MLDKNLGNKYNRLLILEFSHRDKHKAKYYVCRCDCGNICTANIAHVKSGHTKSCGCFARETSVENGKKHKHGKIDTRLYGIWSGIKTRCLNPNTDHKKWYYDKGIDICKEWIDDFMAFYNWSISNGYSKNLTIDRIDANGNYEPSNCRWANSVEQTKNRGCTIRITHDGHEKTLSELSKEINTPYVTLYWRYRNGWSQDEIINGRKKVV